MFPQASFNLQAERQAVSLAALGFPAGGSETFGLRSGAVNVSYTLDAFGGIRRQVEQLNAQAEYQQFEIEATDLTLAANVINTAINEASLQAQIDTTHDIIKADTDALNLVRQRFELGGVSQVDVLQQQSLRDTQVATLPGLEKQLQQQRNQLAVYLGGRPAQYATPTLNLDDLTLPEELPVSLPSKLVEQRPDIRAYGALLHSAFANVGVATANMLPQISLTGSYRPRRHQLFAGVHARRPGLEHRRQPDAADFRGRHAARPQACGAGGAGCRRGAIQQHGEHRLPERRQRAGGDRAGCRKPAAPRSPRRRPRPRAWPSRDRNTRPAPAPT